VERPVSLKLAVYPITFKEAIETLSKKFLECGCAERAGDMFGMGMPQGARNFFSVAVVKDSLPEDIAAAAILSDDARYVAGRQGFTLIIHIDTLKFDNAIDEAKKVIVKAVLAHEMRHFAFYYELFSTLGGDNTQMVYNQFKNIASDKFEKATALENDKTSETIVDEHNITEFLFRMGRYPKEHFCGRKDSYINYTYLFMKFFDYLLILRV
jgi:hypothetical protein